MSVHNQQNYLPGRLVTYVNNEGWLCEQTES